jgi:hypothetical protein
MPHGWTRFANRSRRPGYRFGSIRLAICRVASLRSVAIDCGIANSRPWSYARACPAMNSIASITIVIGRLANSAASRARFAGPGSLPGVDLAQGGTVFCWVR